MQGNPFSMFFRIPLPEQEFALDDKNAQSFGNCIDSNLEQIAQMNDMKFLISPQKMNFMQGMDPMDEDWNYQQQQQQVAKFPEYGDFNRTYSMEVPTAARSFPAEDESKKFSSTSIRIDGVVPTSQTGDPITTQVMSSNEHSQSTSGNKRKQKQSKRLDNQTYYELAQEKISEWNEELKNPDLNKEERRKIQNRISAMHQRIRQKESVSGAKEQTFILQQKYKELVQILEKSTCNGCKQQIMTTIKNKLNSENPSPKKKQTASTGTFKKLLIGFLATVAVVALALPQSNIVQIPMRSLRSQGTPDSDSYAVFQVVTSSSKTFKVAHFPEEQVLDVKQRIQALEGIPVNNQKLLMEGRELQDLEYLSELKGESQLHLMIDKEPRTYRFNLDIMSLMNPVASAMNTLPLGAFKITAILDSKIPIDLAFMKTFWNLATGLQYEQDFLLYHNDQPILEESYALSQPGNFSLKYHFRLSERMNVWRKVSSSHPQDVFLSKVANETFNQLNFSPQLTTYNLAKFSNDPRTPSAIQMFDWKALMALYGNNTYFILDQDEDPFNQQEMLLVMVHQQSLVVREMKCSGERPKISLETMQRFLGADLWLEEVKDLQQYNGPLRLRVEGEKQGDLYCFLMNGLSPSSEQ